MKWYKDATFFIQLFIKSHKGFLVRLEIIHTGTPDQHYWFIIKQLTTYRSCLPPFHFILMDTSSMSVIVITNSEKNQYKKLTKGFLGLLGYFVKKTLDSDAYVISRSPFCCCAFNQNASPHQAYKKSKLEIGRRSEEKNYHMDNIFWMHFYCKPFVNCWIHHTLFLSVISIPDEKFLATTEHACTTVHTRS